MRFADRVLVLKEGRRRAEGAPEDVLTAELLADVYGVRAELARGPSGAVAIIPQEALHAAR
jgi:iron complex transport system ATP-binding protein